MVKDAEAHAEDDKKRKESVDARNQADSLLYTTEKSIAEHGDKLEKADKEKIDTTSNELKKILENDQEGIILLDVRNKSEYEIFSIKESKLIPLKDIENGEAIESIRKMTKEKKLYVHCKSGKRSLKALGILKRNDIQGINVAGGIDAWVSNKLSNWSNNKKNTDPER